MRTTGSAQPAEFLLDILDVLTELGIPYAVVGALAVSYYGIPRSTTDADVVMWTADLAKNEQDITERLVAAGYLAKLSRGDIDDPITRSVRIEDSYANRMDILLGIRGMDPRASDRCVAASLLGSTIRIIAAEDLIAMKMFAGGFQDLEDVRGILEVSGTVLNLDLLRKLAARYGVDVTDKLEKLLDECLPPGQSPL